LEQKVAQELRRDGRLPAESAWKRFKKSALLPIVELQLFCLLWIKVFRKATRPFIQDMRRPGFASRLFVLAKSALKTLLSRRRIETVDDPEPLQRIKPVDSTTRFQQMSNLFRAKYNRFRKIVQTEKQCWVIPATPPPQTARHKDAHPCELGIERVPSHPEELIEND
jgi:hypothetical protein